MRSTLIIVIAILFGGLLVGIGYSIIAHQTMPRSTSYHTAVLTILATAQVDFQDVEVIDGCAPTLQLCHTYAGVVHVQAGRPMTGEITCLERWTTCTFTLREANIVEAPLPEVIDPIAWRWQQLQWGIIRWMRGVGQNRL